MNKTKEYRNFQFNFERNPETRSIQTDQDGMINGYAVVFNSDSVDLGGFIERVDPNSLNETLADGHNIYALWEHDSRQAPVGSTGSNTLELTVTVNGLAIRMDPRRLTVAQHDAIATGDMRMSFGFYTKAQEWDQNASPPIRYLRAIELEEVSFVMNPAYPDTSAAIRSKPTGDLASRLAQAEATVQDSLNGRVGLAEGITQIEASVRSQSDEQTKLNTIEDYQADIDLMLIELLEAEIQSGLE